MKDTMNAKEARKKLKSLSADLKSLIKEVVNSETEKIKKEISNLEKRNVKNG